MSSFENVGDVLRAAKANSIIGGEKGRATVGLTAAFLGHIAASIEALDNFAATLPSEEVLDTLVSSVTTTQDKTLDAYGILHRHAAQSDNEDLLEAADRTRLGLEALSPPDRPGWKNSLPALTRATRLRDGVNQLRTHIGGLIELANETAHMHQNVVNNVSQAVTEGDGAIAELTAYHQETGIGE